MTQQLSRRSKLVGGSSNGLAQLPAGRSIMVRSADGTRLHTEIFGPALKTATRSSSVMASPARYGSGTTRSPTWRPTTG